MQIYNFKPCQKLTLKWLQNLLYLLVQLRPLKKCSQNLESRHQNHTNI